MDDFSGLLEQDANQSGPDDVSRTQTLGILGYFFGLEKVPGAQSEMAMRSEKVIASQTQHHPFTFPAFGVAV
ncbi:hypothetical protein SBX64_08340 [Vibrio rhizosphaerae]|uniref:Uncharacterized protein n=1 Tax=Vibrio rhizosphaerae TaxID=398736 RepID=A0ABU4IT09_9VIBR|nr:hypothetical protein [Vibrio rhizosphaerae]MDW6092552.1 hypothetical protein [Vibrio rhizosphaerae]